MNEREQTLADYLTNVRGVPRQEAELRAHKASQGVESISPEVQEELLRSFGEFILHKKAETEALATNEYEHKVDFVTRTFGMSRQDAEEALSRHHPAPSTMRSGLDTAIMSFYGLVAAGAAVGAYCFWGSVWAYVLLGVALVVGYWSVALWSK